MEADIEVLKRQHTGGLRVTSHPVAPRWRRDVPCLLICSTAARGPWACTRVAVVSALLPHKEKRRCQVMISVDGLVASHFCFVTQSLGRCPSVSHKIGSQSGTTFLGLDLISSDADWVWSLSCCIRSVVPSLDWRCTTILSFSRATTYADGVSSNARRPWLVGNGVEQKYAAYAATVFI